MLSKLKNRYPKEGSRNLCKEFNCEGFHIIEKANELGIKYEPYLKVDEKYLNEFIDIKKPEIAYVLGYFYADAHISNITNKIEIKVAEKNGEDVKYVFLKAIPFNIKKYYHNDGSKRQPTMTFQKGDKALNSILKGYDYHLKSNGTPEKVLNKIPKHLHPFWWQGYFDGDGTLNITKIGGHTGFAVSFYAPVNQNWGFYEKICKELNIKYKVYKAKNKKGEWSATRLCSPKECTILMDYIYSGGLIGLKRKHEKYLQLKNTRNKNELI